MTQCPSETSRHPSGGPRHHWIDLLGRRETCRVAPRAGYEPMIRMSDKLSNSHVKRSSRRRALEPSRSSKGSGAAGKDIGGSPRVRIEWAEMSLSRVALRFARATLAQKGLGRPLTSSDSSNGATRSTPRSRPPHARMGSRTRCRAPPGLSDRVRPARHVAFLSGARADRAPVRPLSGGLRRSPCAARRSRGIKAIPFSSFAHVGFGWSSGGEKIELSRDVTAPNGFRDRRIRPLCHPSERRRRDSNPRRRNLPP